MSRFAIVFTLSLCLAGSAMACGMYMPNFSLGSAFDAIEAEQAEAERAREAALQINWVDEVGEVPRGSLPRGLARARPEAKLTAPVRVVAAVPDAVPVSPVAQAGLTRPVESSTTEQVRAFVRAVFTVPEAHSDTADTADTGH